MGELTVQGTQMRAEACWPITVRYFVRWPFKTALPFSGNNWRRSSRVTRIYVLDISAVSGSILLKSTFISYCKIIYIIKSDSQFPFISQSN